MLNQSPPIGEIPAWILPPAAALFSVLHKVFGDKVPLEANQIRLAGKKVYVDGSKAVRELGISQTPFRIAIQEAFEWFVEHGYLD
jgi:dihydroflavonol-4-reductase